MLIVGGAGFSVSFAGGMPGEAGLLVSMAVGMMAVELERPRCQSNDSRHGLTGVACTGRE